MATAAAAVVATAAAARGPINVPISVPVRGAADAVVATMAVAATAVAAGGSGAGAGGRGGDGATAVVAVATVAAVARRRPCAQAGAAPCRLNRPVSKATLPTDHVDHLLHEAFSPHETCIGPMHMNRFVRAIRRSRGIDIDSTRAPTHVNWPADSPQHTVAWVKLCAIRV